jgi:hypothetical protein
MAIAVVLAFFRLFDNHYVPLFLDESMNALYLPFLCAYTVVVLGVTLMQGIEDTLESALLPLIFLMPLGYKIGSLL